MRVCENCGVARGDNLTFCGACGSPRFKNQCENCGTAFASTFCPSCGIRAGARAYKCPACGFEPAFCPSCGVKAGAGTQKCPDCGFEPAFCPSCGMKTGAEALKCPNCGDAYFGAACPKCGYSVAGRAVRQGIPAAPFSTPAAQPVIEPPVRLQRTPTGFAIAGFVLSILSFFVYSTGIPCIVVASIALVLSILGIVLPAPKRPNRGNGLAIAGLVIAAVFLAMAIGSLSRETTGAIHSQTLRPRFGLIAMVD